MQRLIFGLSIFCLPLCLISQTSQEETIYPPYVNQLGYNLGESKRFVCYGAKDGTPFQLINTRTSKAEFEGEMLNYEGWFSNFNPDGKDEYVIEVEGHGRSVPFEISDHLLEMSSSKLAYDFFVDVRGHEDLDQYDMRTVYGGGPSRDGGAYGLESLFEILLYASNPALFDNWKSEIGGDDTPDLIDLILWHGAFAAKYVDYNGPVANRHGTLGYEGHPRMSYDYWNTLDHLAVICAAYHSFLKPYLSEKTYQSYRKLCKDRWQAYDRHTVVRYWTYSTKWVDQGFQEFNEMGNAYGQSVFRNLCLYLCESAEENGEPEKYLTWAQSAAQDMINHWDFQNPRHMWWIRNAEHITPQALAWFLLVAPEHAPSGTRDKLEQWAIHMKQKTNNFWKYRVHSEEEWAHPRTKELGGAPALGGSMFAVAHLLDDPFLRTLGWAQVDFVFGVNPIGAHLSNKSEDRLAINGYWEGVEQGWPKSHPDGYGQLRYVRGSLDGSPMNHHFPISPPLETTEGKNEGKAFGQDAYATEGWCISNRGWMSTLIFSTLGSQEVRILDPENQQEIAKIKPGQDILIELKAALNLDKHIKDKGWVELHDGSQAPQKIPLLETGVNTGLFRGTVRVSPMAGVKHVDISYGYLGFKKSKRIRITR